MPDGEYSLGGQAVTKNGSHATLHDGTLAGSATDLMGCMKVAATEMGLPLEVAVRAATGKPRTRDWRVRRARQSRRGQGCRRGVAQCRPERRGRHFARQTHSLTCSKIASNVATIYARLRVDCGAMRCDLGFLIASRSTQVYARSKCHIRAPFAHISGTLLSRCALKANLRPALRFRASAPHVLLRAWFWLAVFHTRTCSRYTR